MRVAPRVLSATGPLLARTGTGRPAPDEPTAVAAFFLGAMTMKNCLVNCQTRFSQLRPLPGVPEMSVETTPMGSLGSLLRLAGAGLCKERVWQEAHISFTQVRAARMRNTLVLLCCMYLIVLEVATVRVYPKRSESLSWTPRASFYRQKGSPQWNTGGGKVYSG